MSGAVEELGARLGASPVQLVAIVLSAAGIYLAFLLLVRIFGPRTLHGASTFDAILVVMLGAVAGRVVLGHPPSLLGGVVGLTTLFVMEAIFGQVRTTLRGMRILNASPTLVLADGVPLPDAMRRAHLTDAELASALRRAGAARAEDVACAVMEANGQISVIRRGRPIDAALLDGVVGAERVPRDLLDEDGV